MEKNLRDVLAFKSKHNVDNSIRESRNKMLENKKYVRRKSQENSRQEVYYNPETHSVYYYDKHSDGHDSRHDL